MFDEILTTEIQAQVRDRLKAKILKQAIPVYKVAQEMDLSRIILTKFIKGTDTKSYIVISKINNWVGSF